MISRIKAIRYGVAQEIVSNFLNEEKLGDYLISITGEEADKLVTKDYPRAIGLYFDDIPYQIGDFKLFDKEQASKIISFLYFIKEKDILDSGCRTLYINCYMGMCRSGAVAVFANEFFGLDYNDLIRDNPQIVPNTHVLKTLREVYHENAI